MPAADIKLVDQAAREVGCKSSSRLPPRTVFAITDMIMPWSFPIGKVDLGQRGTIESNESRYRGVMSKDVRRPRMHGSRDVGWDLFVRV